MTLRARAAATWVASAALAVPATVLVVVGPGRHVANDLFGGIGGAAFILMALAFATVGAIVAARVPGNAIGWVFCLVGLLGSAGTLAYQYADYGLYATAKPLAGAATAAVVSNVATPPVAGLLGLALLLFPAGRLPSRRWRPVMAATLLGVAVMVIGSAFRPGLLDDPFATVSNPIGLAGTRGLMNALTYLGWALMWAGVVAAVVSARRRLRRAHGVERQQLKLVLAMGSLVAAVTAADMATWFIWPDGASQARMAVIGLGFAAFPVAAGVAILRYRLYDIDVVVNRTLVYGALTATLAGAYLAMVLVLELALRSVTPGSSLAIAGSTLAVAAIFRPARTRIQDLVDRRFYRRKYDAARTLEGFSMRLREEVDLEALATDLRSVVLETMQPAHVSLWLRSPGARP